jgi:hypothetical protein
VLTYLGITTNNKPGEPSGWDAHAESRGEKMLAAFYLAGRNGMQWYNKSALTGMMLFDKILTKVGLYGGEIWDHRATQTQKLDKQQAQILKATLGMHTNSPTAWVLWETNTLPAAIALDAAKARAWRAWLEKEAEGVQIPKYVRDITEKALGRLGYRKAKFITTDLSAFPNKDTWKDMVQTWAQNTALGAFTIWDASPDNEDNKASEFHPLKIKPKRGDIIDFISKAREWLGSEDLLTVYLQARANAVGLNCDSTVRNHKQVKRHLKRCRKCIGGHNETLIHVWLR